MKHTVYLFRMVLLLLCPPPSVVQKISRSFLPVSDIHTCRHAFTHIYNTHYVKAKLIRKNPINIHNRMTDRGTA